MRSIRAFACGLLRPFGGPHFNWCPNRWRDLEITYRREAS